ncbi:MAG TPA: DUF4136 domain-containing protein [Marinobacter sp.]|jgi:hypothetical protein|nr:DUF4136 domain-containing protein [Marinobacter sp.]
MRVFAILMCAAVLAGCASTVMTDYSSSAVFGKYTSWSFAPPADGDEFVSLDDSRVRDAVVRELNQKALKQVPESEADLLVSWEIVPEERLEQIGVGLGFGFGRGNFGWALSAPPPVREVQEGKLVVRLVERQSGEVIWKATSRRYLNENQSPDTRRELIDEVVSEMFSKYPPGLE